MKYQNENSKISSQFRYLALMDYLAARKLFIDEYNFQAIILASTTIEKYLKSILIIKNQKNYNHLDKLSKFYSQFKKIDIDIESKLDTRFMNLLSNAYKLRYFDKINDIDNFGFFTQQVLGELDYMVNLLENFIELKNPSDELIKTDYQILMTKKDHPIHINNYISLGLSKKEFMEMPSKGFGIKIMEDGRILEMYMNEVISNYNGQINTLKIE